MFDGTVQVVLPGGYFDDRGQLHQDVDLAALTGSDEELLAGRATLGATLVTEVLARCVRRLGAMGRPSRAVVRDMLVADRQYLMLRLRSLTYGSSVTGSCRCDYPDCGERVSLGFSIDDLVVTSLEDKRAHYDLTLGCANDGVVVVSVRLPTGADQEEICGEALADESSARRLLLGRCVLAGEALPGADWVASASPGALLEVEGFLLSKVPLLDLELRPVCPACGRELVVHFDLQDFFCGELQLGTDALFRDVHVLALRYHWSEEAILALSRGKRQRYLELLAESAEGDHAAP